MNCSTCNADLLEASKFCPECGAAQLPASATCTHCGESQPAGSRFCVHCGKPMGQTAVSPSTPPAEGDIEPLVRLLSEESLRSTPRGSFGNSYGVAAIVTVDGTVSEIRTQPSAKATERSAAADFLRGVSEFVRSLIGQRPRTVKTYLISDYRNLPFVSFVHKLGAAGAPKGRLQFSFWIDFETANRDGLNRFLHDVVGNLTLLSVQDFRHAAIGRLTPILAQFSDAELATETARQSALEQLRRQTGISGDVRFSKSQTIGQRTLEVSQLRSPVGCPSCGAEYLQKTKFCEQCGTNLSNADWAAATKSLVAAGGEVLVLKLKILGEAIDGEVVPDWSDERIAQALHAILETELRRRPLEALMTGTVLSELNRLLARDLNRVFQGSVSELQAIDIRSAEQDWFFKTEALIAEELRKIRADRRMLAVDESELDYREAAFAVSLRRLQQSDSQELQERRARLASARDSSQLELEKRQLESATELGIEAIEHAAEQERFARAKHDVMRDKGLERELRSIDRADELVQLRHEQVVEKSAAAHDIELSDIVGDAQSKARRREVSDRSFEQEEALRLKAEEQEKLGRIAEDLQDRQHSRQVDKLKAMADIELQMARQDQDFELQKMQGMKGLDAKQILAMQAAQLAKAAGTGGAASIVQSIAQSHADAAASDLKESMYRQMLEIQEKASDKAAQAQKDAMEAMFRTNAELAKMNASTSTSAAEGYKEAAKIAQSTNEKSMESMAKVATATAGRKSSRDEVSEARNSFQCSSCGHSYEGRKKFCPQCGTSQE